jgi:hypothetical protein
MPRFLSAGLKMLVVLAGPFLVRRTSRYNSKYFRVSCAWGTVSWQATQDVLVESPLRYGVPMYWQYDLPLDHPLDRVPEGLSAFCLSASFSRTLFHTPVPNQLMLEEDHGNQVRTD